MITLETSDFGCYLVVSDDGKDLLIQTDYDYPGVASTFGWSPSKGPQAHCHHVGGECGTCPGEACEAFCSHDGTDGTVKCGCGVTASQFIASAQEWLDDHIGDTAEDPGYFGEE